MKYLRQIKGFTLVEVLVVMVIMGLVMTAVYGLFIDSKKTSTVSEEVVDVQQNLRIGMEALVKDIRMAGFLIPTDDDPVETAAASLSTDNLVLNLSTSTGVYARVTSGSVDISAGGTETITVDSDMATNFSTSDGLRIVTPTSTDSVVDLVGAELVADSEVKAVDSATDTITIGPVAATSINQGDMFLLLKADDATAFPVQVTYQLVDDTTTTGAGINLLQRSVNGGAFQTVAGNINSVTLTYLPDSTDIKAIRVVMTASTDDTKTGSFDSGVKTRSLQTVVNIRNASVE